MEKAKQAVSSFVSGDGHHKTTVTEDTNQAVTNEQVMPHRHENVTTAVDREVHQDHHHTTVQPIKAKETLPEKHHHNVVPVAHKTFDHGNEQETRDTLDREAAKFQNTSATHDYSHSSTTAPAVTGERVHHHVHEHIQPVIHKETIQPHVVHTTVPIHETHHAKPIHHGTTTLPAKTLDEFNREKGALHSKGHGKTTEFDGCPQKFNKELGASEHAGVAGLHGDGDAHDKHHHGHHLGHHHGSDKTAAAAAAAGGAAHKAHNADSRDPTTRDVGERENHHGSGKAAGAAAAGGGAAAAAVAAHKAHNTNDANNQNVTTRGFNNTTDRDHHHHGLGNGTKTAGAATAGNAAASATNKHHNAEMQKAAAAQNAGDRGIGAHSNEKQRGPDSMIAAQTASARANDKTMQDGAANGRNSTSSSNLSTSTADGILHGKHTTLGDSNNNYTASGGAGAGGTGAQQPRYGSNVNGSGLAGNNKNSTASHAGAMDDTEASGKKVSLVDKLNPFKDADGDGHKGIMS